MVKEPINPSHFFCRWALGVLVAVAVLAFSLGNAQAQKGPGGYQHCDPTGTGGG